MLFVLDKQNETRDIQMHWTLVIEAQRHCTST